MLGSESKKSRKSMRHVSQYIPTDWTDYQMEQHDLYNFEAKIDYGLIKDSPVNTFKLEIYYFIPAPLRVNKNTYTKEKFFSDLNNYIRFKTPKMALSGLIDPQNGLSPITRIYNYLTDLKSGKNTEEIVSGIIYEIRILGCMIKSNIGRQVRYYLDRFLGEKTPPELLVDNISKFIEQIMELRRAIKKLRRELTEPHIRSVVRESFGMVDQYISLLIQDNVTALLWAFGDVPAFANLVPRLKQIIEEERKYRENLRSPLLRFPRRDNERYTYWEGIMKKFTQRALYLERQVSEEKSKAMQIFYSLAAGLAMFFSVLVTLIVAGLWPQNSAPFIIAAIIAYMFKDRIKENIRMLSDRFLLTRFPDRKYYIVDKLKGASGSKLGVVKEKMQFIPWNDIPPEILRIRQSTYISKIEQEGKPEVVLRYYKETTLFSDKIREIHDRHGDIMDIIRFNIRNFIQYADDPYRIEHVWDPDRKKVVEIKCAKVYHLNLVIKLKAQDYYGHEEVTYKKVRIILDQRGIKRIHEIPF